MKQIVVWPVQLFYEQGGVLNILVSNVLLYTNSILILSEFQILKQEHSLPPLIHIHSYIMVLSYIMNDIATLKKFASS